MIFMNILRFLIDISFYFSFASVIVSSVFKNYVSVGIVISLIPVIIYVLGVVWRKNYVLSWHRQVDIVTVFWKVYLGFAFVVCLMGAYQELLRYSVPFAVVVICTSILALRMLRQEPEIYLNQEYQKKNMILLGGILVGAWLCSQKFVWIPIKYVLEILYTNLVVPILTLLAMCIGLIVAKIMGLYARILAWLDVDSEIILHTMYGQNEIENKIENLGKESSISSSVLILFGIIVAILGLVMFFRWLNQKWDPRTDGATDIAMSIKIDEIRSVKERSSSRVQQIRRQYRKFLLLYQSCGEKLEICDTSKDISEKCARFLFDKNMLEEMRSIYIRARYDNDAAKSDIKKMKQINHMLKQAMKNK